MKFFQGNRKGMVLILAFIILTTLTAVVVGFIYLASTQLKGSGYDAASNKALWLAEAGIEKAIWYLQTGGLGIAGTTAASGPITEELGNGSYTIEVVDWDFASSTNGAVASDYPVTTQVNCDKANDVNPDGTANNTTYWESSGVPDGNAANYQYLIIHFPYTIQLNRVWFRVPDGSTDNIPYSYTWSYSANGTTWTQWTAVAANVSGGVYYQGNLTGNINWLRFCIVRTKTAGSKARIATISALGKKITSTGTVSAISRTIERTVVVKQTTQTGYGYAEPDWTEI